MIETNCTQEAYNIEFEAIEGYTEKMIAWQVRVKNIMKTDALGQKDNHSLVTSSSSSLRLPKIQFQQFSGELTDWLRFHNQFKRIHEDESIDDGDKFQYLIQATTPKSRARDIVESFPATPENYRKAFEFLRMRFGQEDVLIQVYIEAQLRALESLGVTKEKYAAMLFPLVESCLPSEILRTWERYVGYSSDESGKKDLDSLMKFLSLEVSSEDRIKLARNSFDSEKSNYKNKLGNLCTTATVADLFNSNFKNRKDFKFKNNNNNCIFCEKAHASENCCEAASMLYEVKKNAIIKRGLCYICLKKGHMSHSCRSDVKCIICNKRHYAVLCSKLPLRSGLETESESIENSTTASSSSSNVLANQACTSEESSLTDSCGYVAKRKPHIRVYGRYEVALPWVLDNKLLSSNRKLAENRLESTKRKLIATGKFEEYQDVLDLWLSGKIIEEVNDDKENFVHYLPHRPVIKENSTSKIRPVFDASARTKGSPSLNDCLEKGPNFIEVIPTILNRFRKYKIGVISDIEKSFLTDRSKGAR
ncbi:integrase catalytic domain-containing protein [Trichonephila clavipes]|nr:integrase catalytic domain-containing protein [Trichonephila clavipes]